MRRKRVEEWLLIPNRSNLTLAKLFFQALVSYKIVTISLIKLIVPTVSFVTEK